MTMTLDSIKPKSRCVVVAVHGRDGLAQRLMELGLIKGSRVEVIRLAPLGDPMELELRGYHLSLRKADASRVEVEPCP